MLLDSKLCISHQKSKNSQLLSQKFWDIPKFSKIVPNSVFIAFLLTNKSLLFWGLFYALLHHIYLVCFADNSPSVNLTSIIQRVWHRELIQKGLQSCVKFSIFVWLILFLKYPRWLEYKEGVAERGWEGFWAEIGKVAYLMKLTEPIKPIKPIIANSGCAALFESFRAFYIRGFLHEQTVFLAGNSKRQNQHTKTQSYQYWSLWIIVKQVRNLMTLQVFKSKWGYNTTGWHMSHLEICFKFPTKNGLLMQISRKLI